MNKWKKWFARPAAAVLCTGVLALALSAVPALTLWLGDAGLLAQPHARTQKAGALALTGEDMYLTRVLKKYSRRGSLSGYQRAGTSPDSMYYVEPDGLLFHVEELASAGVLPEEWAAYFMDQIGLSTYQSEDSLGFVNYISYGRRDENLGYYIIGVTVAAARHAAQRRLRQRSVIRTQKHGYAPGKAVRPGGVLGQHSQFVISVAAVASRSVAAPLHSVQHTYGERGRRRLLHRLGEGRRAGGRGVGGGRASCQQRQDKAQCKNPLHPIASSSGCSSCSRAVSASACPNAPAPKER